MGSKGSKAGSKVATIHETARSKQVEGGRNPIEMGSKGSKAGSKVATLPRNSKVEAGRRWSKPNRNGVERVEGRVERVAYMLMRDVTNTSPDLKHVVNA